MLTHRKVSIDPAGSEPASSIVGLPSEIYITSPKHLKFFFVPFIDLCIVLKKEIQIQYKDFKKSKW